MCIHVHMHACMYVRTCVCLSLWLKGPVTDPILGAGHVSIPLLLLPGLEGELSLYSLSLSLSLSACGCWHLLLRTGGERRQGEGESDELELCKPFMQSHGHLPTNYSRCKTRSDGDT